MENIAFIDIFTTQNELYGKNNCPIQFCCELYTNDDINSNHSKVILGEKKKIINIVADEPISIAGYLNSHVDNDMMNGLEYNGKPLKDALEAIYTLLYKLSNNNIYICGYNHLNYDLKILNEHFKRVLNKEPINYDRNYILDVMDMSEVLIPIEKIGNYSMDSVFTYLFNDIKKLNELKSVKSTATDVKITKLIFLKLIKTVSDYDITFSELKKRIEEKRDTIDTFNFGKYKGLKYSTVFDLDKTYLNWILNNKTMNESKPTVIKNIRAMYNKTV